MGAFLLVSAALAPDWSAAPGGFPPSSSNAALNVSLTDHQVSLYLDCNATPSRLVESFAGYASGGSPPYSYSWSFDDGSQGAVGPYVNHTFVGFAGRYVVNLTVNDTAPESASGTINVTVPGIGCPNETIFLIFVFVVGTTGIAACLIMVARRVSRRGKRS